jgi:hypothetical protein
MLIYLFRRVFFVSCALLANLAQAAAAVDATALARQREQFPMVWETAKHAPDDAWLRLAPCSAASVRSSAPKWTNS